MSVYDTTNADNAQFIRQKICKNNLCETGHNVFSFSDATKFWKRTHTLIAQATVNYSVVNSFQVVVGIYWTESVLYVARGLWWNWSWCDVLQCDDMAVLRCAVMWSDNFVVVFLSSELGWPLPKCTKTLSVFVMENKIADWELSRKAFPSIGSCGPSCFRTKGRQPRP